MPLHMYKSRDIVPVFIKVLDMCAYFYAQIALKIAILDHYQQLKNNRTRTHLNEDLLINIASAVSHITATLDKIAEIHLYYSEHYLQSDKRILGLAQDLFWSNVCDLFPEEIDYYNSDSLDYVAMVDQYVISLIEILKILLATVQQKGFERKYHCTMMQLRKLEQQLQAHQLEIEKYNRN